jgi:hypothetical protein
MQKRVGSSDGDNGSGGTSVSKSSSGGHGAHPDAPPLYVITLVSSIAPVQLWAPTAPELAGLAVFRSRQVDEGRERFRLHIGYFMSPEAAEQVLQIIRATYPAAMIAVAPQSNMGSLDDTAVARFSILHPITPPAPAAAPAPPAPVAPVATARVEPVPAEAAPAQAVPAPAEPAPASALTDDNGVAPPAPAEKAYPSQHYAVQLMWSTRPIDVAKIPTLELYTGYLLYAVETEPGPQRFYGVRLGFYADALSARLVAQYVRPEFKGVAVVPVSQREMTRASTAVIRLGSSRAAQASSGSSGRWPATVVPVDRANLRKAFSPAML